MPTQYYPFNTSQVSVSNTAVQLLPVNVARSGVNIINTGAVNVYIGNSASVTSSTGYPVIPNASIGFATTLSIYAITASSSATVGILETQ